MHAIIFENTQKYQIKMKILTKNNQNFQKPSRNPSKSQDFEEKKFWIAHQKNLAPRMLSHRGNVRTSKFWRKIEGKEAKFLSKIYEGHKRI